MSSFKCHVCGGEAARDEFLREVFTVEGRRMLVERIQAEVCRRCGEASFSRETAEHIRRLVHGAGHPVRTEPLEVYALV
ncbi:MAG: YgiT-type zinc finger protein [Planctomycetes bacterium]|nr:YgiT-type zinc finger protein [Planctomycetota bacterium]